MKIVYLHGNGGCTADMHWYPSSAEIFISHGVTVILKTLPDNKVAHENIWIPYIRNTLHAGEDTILIGHSSGSITAMRFAEQYPLKGSVLVSAYHTHLGSDNERKGGWFDRPWDWSTIRNNQDWIIQFSSIDDPWIPISEPRHIQSCLQSEYHEFKDRGHFTGDRSECRFPELITSVLNRI